MFSLFLKSDPRYAAPNHVPQNQGVWTGIRKYSVIGTHTGQCMDHIFWANGQTQPTLL